MNTLHISSTEENLGRLGNVHRTAPSGKKKCMKVRAFFFLCPVPCLYLGGLTFLSTFLSFKFYSISQFLTPQCLGNRVSELTSGLLHCLLNLKT